MFNRDQNYASEPEFSAFLYVIYRAIIQVRYQIRYDEPMSNDQLHDLMDALHNIPTFLREGENGLSKQHILDAIRGYDRKWAHRVQDIKDSCSLENYYNEGTKRTDT